ncbi:type II secretion system F family protein [Streptomyces sp. JJ36]|uniref:type II secretion system F family protein n=1 Tax=Streptomyces sp. JJ36 TaxID=2736645 RepID=UPI001F408705|nr:type II secretion system F family protein [Streptomyces sp. JJ36]MCF6522578.1 type II secretion system F family protein [Streptomyces sp. JJ36]
MTGLPVPSLWTTGVLVAAAGLLAALLARQRGRGLQERARLLTKGQAVGLSRGRPRQVAVRWLRRAAGPRWRAERARDAALAFAAGVGGGGLLGGPLGWAGGAVGAYGLWRVLRRRTRLRAGSGPERAVQGRVERELPLAAELLAACLAAGSAPAGAAEAVGRSFGGPLGARLRRAAAELRLGGAPEAAWARFGALPGCADLARCMERAGTTGVPAVEEVSRLATECRARRSRAATARTRRAAVHVTGPLGLCFLPAFLAVGVAPVVLGLAGSLR